MSDTNLAAAAAAAAAAAVGLRPRVTSRQPGRIVSPEERLVLIRMDDKYRFVGSGSGMAI